MTPREELGRRLGRELADNRRNLQLQAERSQAVLDGYAIGKWVPVSERLPDNGQLVMAVSGSGMPCMTVFQEGKHFISNESGRTFIGVAKWLELDLPEVAS